MKKMFAILLALAMLLSLAVPAMADEVPVEVEAEQPAEAEQPVAAEPAEPEAEAAEAEAAEALPDVTGAWHGRLLGMSVELTLNEGGGYTLEIEGAEGTRNGVWTRDAEGVYCDKDKEEALTLMVEGETLTVDLEGTDVKLTRTPPETFQPAEEKPESSARLRDFAGDWTCNMVGIFDMFVDPLAEGGDSPMALNIDGETVSMTTSGDDTPVSATASYSAGVLTLSLGSDSGIECTLHALTDGNLRMDVVTVSGTMNYYFIPTPEEAEEEPEEEEDFEDEEEEEEDFDEYEDFEEEEDF